MPHPTRRTPRGAHHTRGVTAYGKLAAWLILIALHKRALSANAPCRAPVSAANAPCNAPRHMWRGCLPHAACPRAPCAAALQKHADMGPHAREVRFRDLRSLTGRSRPVSPPAFACLWCPSPSPEPWPRNSCPSASLARALSLTHAHMDGWMGMWGNGLGSYRLLRREANEGHAIRAQDLCCQVSLACGCCAGLCLACPRLACLAFACLAVVILRHLAVSCLLLAALRAHAARAAAAPARGQTGTLTRTHALSAARQQAGVSMRVCSCAAMRAAAAADPQGADGQEQGECAQGQVGPL